MYKLAHVCISSTDLAASEHFYSEVLGLEKRFDFKKDDKLYGFYFALDDNTFIEVFIESQIEKSSVPAIKHICLEVADIDNAIEAIKKKNWPIGEKSQGCDNTWQVWFADPDGTAIELHQYTAKSSQQTGVDCIVDW